METDPNPDPTSQNGQKYLGAKGLLVFLAFLSAFIPLSTDLYLPALPGMAGYFQAPVKLVNLTLVAFFVFYAVSTLFWGPMSDKYGRKPIMVIGLLIYTLASILCARSGNIFQLIAFRILQAVGGGGATAVATAVVKDVYSGRKRESVLAIIQVMVIIAPILAPVIGAILLGFTSWRGIFWALAGISLIALAASALLEETSNSRFDGTWWQTIGRLGVVLKNPGFTALLLTFSPTAMSMMAFIAASSYIYIQGFGLSEQSFSYFFAFNAGCAMSGPMVYLFFSRRFRRRSIIITCFAAIAMSGLVVFGLGNHSPYVFALSLVPTTLAGSALRAPSTNLMLEQQRQDAGSAASLITCSALFMGSIGMMLISMPWGDRIRALGMIITTIGVVCGGLWLLISKKTFVKGLPESNTPAVSESLR